RALTVNRAEAPPGGWRTERAQRTGRTGCERMPKSSERVGEYNTPVHMKLEGFNKGMFDRFGDDAVHRMHLFIGGANPCNINNETYTNDHCGPGSEESETCKQGAAKD